MMKDMGEKEYDLLMKDLCGRLPYGVKVSVTLMDSQGNMGRIDTELKPAHMSYLYSVGEQNCHWKDVKPYLRPMSSMSEEERKEYNDLYYQVPIQRSDGNAYRDTKMVEALHIDWLNRKMFDYRGLIPKGLANEAPEGMYG